MEKLLLLITAAQIIFESLPVSSSGHVMLTSILAKKFGQNQEFYFSDLLDPLLHIPAFIAIALTFYRDWMPLFRKLLQAVTRLFTKQKTTHSQQKLLFIFLKILGLIFLADIATSIFYFFFKVLFKNSLTSQSPQILLLGFCCTTLILISLLIKQKVFLTKPEPLNLKKALILGVIQGLAFVPGISRFASTYVAGCWLNLGTRRAFQISFLLHLPLIIADALFHGIVPIFKNPTLLSIFSKNFIFIALISTIITTLLLMFTYKLALKGRLWLFSFYMIIPITLLIVILNS